MKTPVNIEIAKLLKIHKFKGICLSYFFEDGEFRENEITVGGGDDGNEYLVEYEDLLENWNDGFVTKKNGERCFGCNKSNGYFETFSAPTIAEAVMWLYEKYNIWISISININGNFEPTIKAYTKVDMAWELQTRMHNLKTPTEAYTEAILHTLKNII